MQRLDLGEVFTYFGDTMFFLHRSGSISTNRFKNQNPLVQRDAMNTAISHLNIFPFFKLESTCTIVHKDQEPRNHKAIQRSEISRLLEKGSMYMTDIPCKIYHIFSVTIHGRRGKKRRKRSIFTTDVLHCSLILAVEWLSA